MARIAMFGGSFNPIHSGHVQLMQICKSALDIDRVILIPSQQPVHKVSYDMADGADRFRMCADAVHDLSWCSVDNMELTRTEKSYTILSLETLRERYPTDQLFLLIGSDMLFIFTQWYRYKEILEMAEICAIARTDLPDGALYDAKRQLEQEGGVVHILPCQPFEVSSTEIRSRVKSGVSVEGLVPPTVAAYISERGLYR